MSKTILFIGGGNMAEGLMRGMINQKVFEPSEISVFDVVPERLQHLQNTYGVRPVSDKAQAVSQADTLFIAVRPQDAVPVLNELKELGADKKLTISICAGISLEKLEAALGKNRIFRVMPNVLIDVRHGYSAVCANSAITAQDKAEVTRMLEAVGQIMFIDESLFDTFTAFSGSGPAYIYHCILGLVDGGVLTGFSRADAYKIVLANCIGAAEMIKHTGKHPCQLQDTMTSPDGCTIEGLMVLNKAGLQGILMDCVKMAVDKVKRM